MVHGARIRERLAGPFWRLGGDPCRLAGGLRLSVCLCACVAAACRSTGDGQHLGQPWQALQPAERLLAKRTERSRALGVATGHGTEAAEQSPIGQSVGDRARLSGWCCATPSRHF